MSPKILPLTLKEVKVHNCLSQTAPLNQKSQSSSYDSGTTYTVKFKYKYVSANYNGQHPISLNISQNGSATTLSSSTFATNNNWTVKETTFTPDQNLSYDLIFPYILLMLQHSMF